MASYSGENERTLNNTQKQKNSLLLIKHKHFLEAQLTINNGSFLHGVTSHEQLKQWY